LALEHARAGEIVSLQTPAFAGAGTRAIVRTPSFEAIRLVVRSGAVIPTHQVPGRLTLHCLTGRIKLQTSSNVVELQSGDWLYLEQAEPHSLEGLEAAELLMTIMFDGQLG
jgi:quercetin dioxygenase-like cupin family protein